MENIVFRKGLVIAIIVCFVGTGFVPSVNAYLKDDEKDNDNNIMSEDMDGFYPEMMNFSGHSGDSPPLIDNDKIDNSIFGNNSILSIHYNEEIFIHENGAANFQLEIDVPPSQYAEMYREILGAPSTATRSEVMPIPEAIKETIKDNITAVSLGKESYYHSLYREQWYQMGLPLDITYSEMIPFNDSDECSVFLKGNAYPYITDYSDDKWKVLWGPSATQNMSNVSRAMLLDIGFIKLMLNYFDGTQVFRRMWTTEIHFPESASLSNSHDLQELNWVLNFGGGTFLNAFISDVNESTIILEEVLQVTEYEDIRSTPFREYKSFNIEYTLPNSPGRYRYDEVPRFNDSRDRWSKTFGGTLGPKTIDLGPVEISFKVHVSVTFGATINTEKASVWAEVYGTASCTATIEGEFVKDTGWINIINPLGWWIPVAPFVAIYVEAKPQFKVEVGATASISVTTSAWFRASLEIGASWSDGWKWIWEHSFDKGYEPPHVEEAEIKVWAKASIGVEISAMIWDIFGPFVRPSLYLYAEAKLPLNDELFWYVKLGIDVTVGVKVGIPYFWEKSWDWSIADFKILEYSSIGDPSLDTEHPETQVYVEPMFNGWAREYIFIDFSAVDYGEVASGVDETYWNGHTYDPNKYSIWVLFYGPGMYPGAYPINYHSVDLMGNVEPTKTYSVGADLQPPTSYLVDTPPEGGTIWAYDDTITIDADSDVTGYDIWYLIGHDSDGWGDEEWKNGEMNCPVSFSFTSEDQYDDVGYTWLAWAAKDGLGNVEDIHYAVYEVYVNPDRLPVHNIDKGTQYPTIQDAINYANTGNTIEVDSGTYYENLIITKDQISLIGENQATTIIDGLENTVISIDAYDITINGFTIRNGYHGITVEEGYFTGGSIIYNNRIIDNNYYGIHINYKGWATIHNNTITDNIDGVYLDETCCGNIINDNYFNRHSHSAICADNSWQNYILRNYIGNSSYGVIIDNSHTTTVRDNDIQDSICYGVIIEWNSYHNDVSYNYFSNNKEGIVILSSNDCLIENNDLINNDNRGIYIGDNSYSNTIKNNNFSNNQWGMTMYSIYDNNVFNNIFLDNINHGIYIGQNSYSNSITWNEFSNNGWGMTMNSVHDNYLQSNNFNNNENQGIYIGSNSYLNNLNNNDFTYNDMGIYFGGDSYNNNIQDNDINCNFWGVYLDSVHDNTLIHNDFLYNDVTAIIIREGSSSNLVQNNDISFNGQDGISLYNANNNNFINNIITNNDNVGLSPGSDTYNNQIYHNTFKENNLNAINYGNNQWDNGNSGNYWDDYTGKDYEGDDIGDTPYTIHWVGNDVDHYPLMTPWPLHPVSFSNWNYPSSVTSYGDIFIEVDISCDIGIISADIHYDYDNDDSEDGVSSMNIQSGDRWSGVIPFIIGRPINISFYIRVLRFNNYYRRIQSHIIDVISELNVVTNASVNVGMTDAIIEGYFESILPGNSYDTWFEWGDNQYYGNKTINQSKIAPSNFSENIIFLHHWDIKNNHFVGFINETHWEGETFTTDNLCQISYISLRIYKYAYGDFSGKLILGIRNTDNDGKPIGPDLVNVTIDGENLSISERWEYFDFDNYQLLPNTRYAIVLYTTFSSPNPDDIVIWAKGDPGLYDLGKHIRYDAGIWYIDDYHDMMFRIYRENLSEGTIYHYRAAAGGLNTFTEYGSDHSFLTKPREISSFTSISISGTEVELLWVDGNGGEGAYIEYSTTPDENWDVGDHTKIDGDGYVSSPCVHTGLLPNTVYYYKAWAYAEDQGYRSDGTTTRPFGDYPQITEIITGHPTVTTNDSTGVEETNATLHGYLSDDGGAECTVWIENPYETYQEQTNLFACNPFTATKTRVGDNYDSFTGRPKNLSIKLGIQGSPTGTVYARIRNQTDDSIICETSKDMSDIVGGETYNYFEWENTTPIEDENIYILLEWYDYAADNYLKYCYEWFANGIKYEGSYSAGATPVYRFTYWDAWGNTTLNEGEEFIGNATGLDSGQLYHYRAVATNSLGTSYGSDKVFMTKPFAPSNFSALILNITQINLNWDIGGGTQRTVIRRDSNVFPTNHNMGVLVYNGTDNSFIDTVPDTNIQYYYSAWSFTSQSWLYQWSDIYSLAYTGYVSSPIILTNTSTAVDEYDATLHGFLQNDGNSTCKVWFEYGRSTDYGNFTRIQDISEGDEFYHNGTYPGPFLFDNFTLGLHTIPITNSTQGRAAAQIFTPIETYVLKKIELKLEKYRGGGNLTVSIRNSDGEKPIGNDLVYITVNVDDLPDTSEWVDFNFNNMITVYEDTKYAIVAEIDEFDSGLVWWYFGLDYSGGDLIYYCPIIEDWRDRHPSRDEVGLFKIYGFDEFSLSPGKLYHYCAVASNHIWTTYGSDSDFLTKPIGILSFNTIPIHNNMVELSWVDGNGGEGAYIEYSTTPDENWEVGDHTKIDGDGYVSSPCGHTGLLPNTVYYYKAWAYAEDQGFRSDGTPTRPFGEIPQTSNTTTLSSTVPYIITNETTNVEEISATFHGYLEDDGGEPCKVRFKHRGWWPSGDDELYTENQTKIAGEEVSIAAGGIAYYHVNQLLSYNTWISPWNAFDGQNISSAYLYYSGSPPPYQDDYLIGRYTNYSSGHDEHIYRVKMRVLGATEGNDVGEYFVLGFAPKFKDYSNGDFKQAVWNSQDGQKWSDWFDITHTTNAPYHWTWDEIANLGVILDCYTMSYQPRCYQAHIFKVEIEVSYGFFPGKLYYYQAIANNTYHSYYGLNRTFLTKPMPLENFDAIPLGGKRIELSWDNTEGGIGAYVEYTDQSPLVPQTVTYYFDDYDPNEVWENYPPGMVDGDGDSYAMTQWTYDTQRLISNTFDGIFDFDSDITKVEIRAKVKYTWPYGELPDGDIRLIPIFNGFTNGNVYVKWANSWGGWTDWVDITNDPSGPGENSWDKWDILNLDCRVGPQMPLYHTMRCSKVEIRVTYNHWNLWEPGDHEKVNGHGYCYYHPSIAIVPSTSQIYYFKAWAYAKDQDIKSDGTSTRPFGDNPQTAIASTYEKPPTVITNDASYVGESYARLNGFLEDGAGEYCNVWFEYGNNTSYGNNTIPWNHVYANREFYQGIGFPILYEHIEKPTPYSHSVDTTHWYGQTFAIGQNHIPTSIRLSLFKWSTNAGSALIHVAIQNIDQNGYPTGEDLAYGTLEKNNVQYGPPGSWCNIPLKSNTVLTKGTKYAFVCKMLSGSVDVESANVGPPYYSPGNLIYTYDSGNTWNNDYSKDIPFLEYGTIDLFNPGTCYHYRSVANNSYGTTFGDDSQFLTKPEPLSSLRTETMDNGTNIKISWKNEIGGDGAYIEYTKNYNGTITDSTYFFNQYDPDEAWESSPFYMADKREDNYAAWTHVNGSVEFLNGNNCSGTYLGPIIKIELRAKALQPEGYNNKIIIRPVFNGIHDGENHLINVSSSLNQWSDWIDITSDKKAPSIWKWNDIKNLDCDIEALLYQDSYILVYKVEIRVTYSGAYSWNPGDQTKIDNDGYVQTPFIFNQNELGTYHFKVWSYAEDEDIYSNGYPTRPFGKYPQLITGQITYLSVTTNETSHIGDNNATLSGFLEDDGNTSGTRLSETYVWFEYGKNSTYEENTTKLTTSIRNKFHRNIGKNIIIYYFSDYDNQENWKIFPEKMVDGNESTYASEWDENVVQKLTSNVCDGSDLGPITKVELRAKSYWNGYGNSELCIRPVFNGSYNGDDHWFDAGNMEWDEYFDITNDTNAPSNWNWDDIKNLDCTIKTGDQEEYDMATFYCSKIEIIVTYGDPLIPGTIYQYRAIAQNSTKTVYGTDKSFMTRPSEPYNFSIFFINATSIDVSWKKGNGANTTYIERNTIINWNRGEGTLVYNDSGTNIIDADLDNSKIYYYHAWSYTKNNQYDQFSDDYVTLSIFDYEKTRIHNITINPKIQLIENHVNISCYIEENAEIDSVFINITGSNGFFDNKTLDTRYESNIYYYNRSYISDGIYEFSITAIDKNSNRNTSSIHKFAICSEVYNEILSSGENILDVTIDTDTLVVINVSGSTNINIGNYTNNPYPYETLPATVLNKFIAIQVDDESKVNWPVYIRIYYTEKDLINSNLIEEQLVGIFFWNESGKTWNMHQDTGVNTTDQAGYNGYFWAYIDFFSFLSAPFGDSKSPAITDISDSPDPQQSGKNVYISCYVTDNMDVSTVMVNITHCSSYINITMNNIPGTDYYYYNAYYTSPGVYSYFIWANDTSGDSNVSAVYTFEITSETVSVDISLSVGWNLVTVPVENVMMASGLAENITGSIMISRFDSVNQTYKTYIVGGPPGFDFPIVDGYGYFVLVDEESMLSLSGYRIDSVSVPLEVGWNMLGWYHTYNTTASSLSENITGSIMVSWFDPISQSFKTYIVDGPPGFDFTITSGMGLFVLVDESSVWHGEG